MLNIIWNYLFKCKANNYTLLKKIFEIGKYVLLELLSIKVKIGLMTAKKKKKKMMMMMMTTTTTTIVMMMMVIIIIIIIIFCDNDNVVC